MDEIVLLDEDDARRPVIEAMLATLAEPELRALWRRTRMAGAAARAADDMERVFLCVRGTKTIQRIAAGRGILLHAGRLRGADD
jgi:hypothetical protein